MIADNLDRTLKPADVAHFVDGSVAPFGLYGSAIVISTTRGPRRQWVMYFNGADSLPGSPTIQLPTVREFLLNCREQGIPLKQLPIETLEQLLDPRMRFSRYH